MKKGLLLIAVVVFAIVSGSVAQITDPYFTPVNYVGAFGNDDWTDGWANWTPQNTIYPAATTEISGEITSNTTWSPNSSPVWGKASFTHAKLNNSFFTSTNYIGAFGTTDWTAGWANWNPQQTSYGTPNVTVSGEITANTTWTATNVYLLSGFVYVRNGATLTIQPGTVIRGDKTTKGTLIIEKGGKIIADGTASQPIVFTSNIAAGSRDYGDWGGVVICGIAAINVPGGSATIEGGPASTYGGGTNPNDQDSSGVMRYVRLEFGGIPLEPDKEINGLTMGGVGSKTVISNIQVSYCGDDAYEWFGGTVDAKYLIAFRTWDDDFDTDYGFRGRIQFGVVLRDPNIADISGSNGFESDNDGQGNPNTPFTEPVFSNISVFGPRFTSGTTIHTNYRRAMHLRRNTKTSIFNSIFTGYPTGLFIDGTAAQGNATAGSLNVQNCLMAGMANNFQSSFERSYFMTPSRNNDTLANNTQLMLVDPFNLATPNFMPTSSNTVYLLKGFVYVRSGATLTIQPGTIIRGDKTTKGTLIIEKGAKIMAEGTDQLPIVFTSNQSAGNRDYGDWGGVVICGKASINVPGGIATIEGGPASTYGGGTTPDDNDNSGIFKYCRIEFPGFPLEPDKEINGLTMGGVGKGTTIENVQISYSGDDAFEWFGGTVDAKHLIAYRTWDDDFDTDYGFRGKVQFGVVLRDPNIADISGSNGFESDNDGQGNPNAPFTSPIFSNISIFGPKVNSTTTVHSNYRRAMHLRRNTKIKIYNAVFAGYPTGLFVDGTTTQTNATAGDLIVKHTIMSGMGNFFANPFDRAFFTDAAHNNDTIADNSGLMVYNPFNLNNPDFRPMAGSPLWNRSYWASVKTIEQESFNLASFPNPAETQTTIEYTLKSDNNVSMQVYDLSGRLITTLVNEKQTAGTYEVSYDVSELRAGLYFVRFSTNSGNATLKIMVR